MRKSEIKTERIEVGSRNAEVGIKYREQMADDRRQMHEFGSWNSELKIDGRIEAVSGVNPAAGPKSLPAFGGRPV
jgi:hypothetical protein